jgi:SAM-dependent methyltransferase
VLDNPRPFRPAGRLRALSYAALWRLSTLLSRASTACACLAAGLLRRDDLRAAMQRQFSDFGASPDEVDEGLNPFEVRVYAKWLPPSGRVLLVGSGAGRDLIGLARLGYAVAGIEQAPGLVDACRGHLARLGIAACVRAGFVEAMEIDGQYDAVIFAPSCYSNMRSSEARVATLRRLRSHLAPGGRMVVHYIATGSPSRLATALVRASTTIAIAGWTPEAGDSFSFRRLAPDVPYFFHTFLAAEVVSECASAALRAIGEEHPPDRSHCLIVQKDGD